MEEILSASKQHFLDLIRSDPASVNEQLKEMERMSRCLKEMFSFFMGKEGREVKKEA